MSAKKKLTASWSLAVVLCLTAANGRRMDSVLELYQAVRAAH